MAFTSTWRQNETKGFRGLGALIVGGLIALLALVPAVMFLWPQSPTGRPTMIRFGSVGDYEAGKPVMVHPDGMPIVWIVRQDEKAILAFIGKDTYLGCTVPWRPMFTFNDVQGWFRDPCHASTYGLDGTCVYGPCYRSLDQVPVVVRRDALFLDVAKVIRGGPVSPGIVRPSYWQPLLQ